jgi:hypothetical protein
MSASAKVALPTKRALEHPVCKGERHKQRVAVSCCMHSKMVWHLAAGTYVFLHCCMCVCGGGGGYEEFMLSRLNGTLYTK